MSEFSAVAEGAVVTVCAGEGHRFFVERRYRRYLDLAEAERPAALQEVAADLVSRTRWAGAMR